MAPSGLAELVRTILAKYVLITAAGIAKADQESLASCYQVVTGKPWATAVLSADFMLPATGAVFINELTKASPFGLLPRTRALVAWEQVGCPLLHLLRATDLARALFYAGWIWSCLCKFDCQH